MELQHSGTNYDFTTVSSTGGTGDIPQSVINIIEQNTGTQVNIKVLYTEVDWLNGVPTSVRKYVDNTKAVQVYLITITWLNGVPTQVVSNNMDDGIITTTNITWLNGVPVTINKVES